MNQHVVKEFGYKNPSGGSGSSDCRVLPTEQFVGVAVVQPTEWWDDAEIGRRYIGRAVSADLCAYLARNAHPDDHRVFWGEFDVVEVAP